MRGLSASGAGAGQGAAGPSGASAAAPGAPGLGDPPRLVARPGLLRYHMVVVTRDTTLKRAIRRLTTATGSSADFLTDPAGLDPQHDMHLVICDARSGQPEQLVTAKVPPTARILYLLESEHLIDRVGLLRDNRVTSLVGHDDRFDEEEFIATATKALRGEVFGLQKYFPWGVTTFSMKVKSYEEKLKAIEVLLQYASLAGCRGAVKDRIQLVCDELMMNALYHAPVARDGTELYAGKSIKELAQLPEVSAIQVQYGCSGRYFGVAVRDGGGSLTQGKILDYLERARDASQVEDKAGGAGLGLISILRSVSKLIFNLDRGHSTEVIGLFDMEPVGRGKPGARSVHIFTAPPHDPRMDAAEVLPVVRPRSSGTAIWIVAAALLAVASALGAIFYMQRNQLLAAGEGPAPATPVARPERLVTVYPDPGDAVIRLDGVVIEAGTPVRLSADTPGTSTLSVERAGYRSKTFEIPRADGAKEHVLHVSLAPLKK